MGFIGAFYRGIIESIRANAEGRRSACAKALAQETKEEDVMNITRRGFLKGAGIIGAGVAAGGLAACSPSRNASEDSANEATTTQGGQLDNGMVDWLGEPPSISDEDCSETLDADVVVVGLSDAGCAALRAAAEEGARVIGIEKSEDVVTAGTQCTVIGGPLQEALGRPEITTEEVVRQLQIESGYRSKAAIMERFINEMPSVFQWIIEADPDIFVTDTCFPVLSEEEKTHALIPERYPEPDPDWSFRNEAIPTFPGTFTFGDLTSVMKKNVAKAEETGTVETYFGHFAEKLIMEDGRCVGVYVRRAEDGAYLRIDATNGVILATGDYSSNQDMMKAFLPEVVEHGFDMLWLKTDVEGNPTNTGDGHKMAAWAGAKIQDYHSPSMHHMGGGAGADGRGVMGINGYLNLNLKGKRFMNEDLPGQQVENQIELQPRMTTYQFFDSKWPEQCSKFPAGHGVVCYFSEEDETSYINHRSLADVEAAVADGRALSSDTIEGLLEQIEGMDAEEAKASIERYNELCHNGVDEDFHKMARRLFPLENPPYYAVKFEPCLMITCHGGPSSDENAHTYTEDGDVIPGLYVAGNTMGDRFAMQKPISICGVSVGLALFYGTIAGRNAARGI